MKKKWSILLLAVFLVLSAVCMGIANHLQHGSGSIEIIDGSFEDYGGVLTYKLYKPKSASASDKAPGVLLLHGYQNDHETCAAYAIELARRGAVVLCLDEYGHGSSTVGLKARGYVNHKVTVNYGLDNEKSGSFVSIGGAQRYRLMMNFSNLSFFDKRYTTDSDGNKLTDSSCGGIFAWAVLADMDIVDSSRMALSGHSMGTWSSWSVAAAYSGTEIEPKATVLQCGELFTDDCYDSSAIHFNNVLLLQAKYDEFSYFRDYKNVVNDSLLATPLRCEFLGCSAGEASWNRTYGSFADGTARRMQLLMTNHRLTTHHSEGLAVALDWFSSSLGFKSSIANTDQTYMTKEWLVLGAMGCVLLALIPLMSGIYILCSLAVIIANIKALPSVLGAIFKGAFTPEAAVGGAVGITLKSAVSSGLGRGLFSNEAGQGSAPIAHASSRTSEPVEQGLHGMFEVFFDTIVICTLTCLAVLMSGTGIEYVTGDKNVLPIDAFSTLFGEKFGSLTVAVSLLLFAFTTMITWSLYGVRCFEYLARTEKFSNIYRLLFMAAVVYGATVPLGLAYRISDTLNGIMTIPNLVAVLGLSGTVATLSKKYFASGK